MYAFKNSSTVTVQAEPFKQENINNNLSFKASSLRSTLHTKGRINAPNFTRIRFPFTNLTRTLEWVAHLNLLNSIQFQSSLQTESV